MTYPLQSRTTPHDFLWIDTPDAEIDQWLLDAQHNDGEALEQLLCWAYATARHYFTQQALVEPALTEDDAAELASAFVLAFERAWPQVRSATHYTRRMLKNNLRRYLYRVKVQRRREAPTPPHLLSEHPSVEPALCHEPSAWRWNDLQQYQYRLALRVLRQSDERTRRIVTYRLEDPPRPFSEIAATLKVTEPSVRMRVTRYYHRVRRAFNQEK